MPNTAMDIAEKIAERVRASIQNTRFQIDASGRAIPITVSIGIADRGADSGPDSVYKRADKALYRAKTEGRNRVSADAA
jgi:two-component system, cell cycle response regulator